VFNNGNQVIFDDTAAGPNFNVTVAGGNVSPSGITVDTNASYSITSSAGAAVAGLGQLVKNGTGTLTLSGPASYTGGTLVNAGTVRLGSSNALPDFGAVTIATGATLDLQANSDTVDGLTVNGSVTGTGGTLTVGSLALGSGAVFQPNLTLNGNLTKTGATGSTLAGTVNLNGPRTVTVDTGTSPELTLNGVVSNGALTKAGTGTLVLGSAGNTYSGGTTVSAGTLRLGAAGALPSTTALTVNTGGTLDSTNLALNLSSLSGSGGSIAMGNGTLTVNQTATSSFAGVISGTGAQVIKQGSGVLGLTGNSTYTGGLNIQAGRVNASSGAGGTGGITVNPGTFLQLAGNLTSAVTLAGGTYSAGVDATASGNLNVTANSSIHLFSEDNNANTATSPSPASSREPGISMLAFPR
jgi:autotransporter-associated beta strand protein